MHFRGSRCRGPFSAPYTGNEDWAHHNWYATRHRSPEGRWRFHSWDAEKVLEGLEKLAGSKGRLVPPDHVSSTLQMHKRGAIGSMTLAIGID